MIEKIPDINGTINQRMSSFHFEPIAFCEVNSAIRKCKKYKSGGY